MNLKRVRITLPDGLVIVGNHLSTIPEETTANAADIELFFGIKLGEPGWLAERYRVESYARYLIDDGYMKLVVNILPGTTVDELEA